MNRLSLFLFVSSLVPAVAGAQTAPPAPPAAPTAPTPAAAPAAAPLMAPAVIATPFVAPIPAAQVDDAVAAARAVLSQVDVDAVRGQAAAAVADAEARVQAAADQVRAAAPVWNMALNDFAYDFQGTPFAKFGGSSNDSQYNNAQRLLQNHQYDQAIVQFDHVIASGGSHADGAYYYKAWALSKLGRSDDAAATLADLRKNFPQSRYLNDARALEADVKKLGPGQVDDDDLKLLAIQGMQGADPARVLPLLESVLNATNSLAVKENALYVIATIDQPAAHELLLSYAKGKGNPDLQRTAIRYLGARGHKTSSAELIDIYNSNPDLEVRLSVIAAFRVAGDKQSLVAIAAGRGFGGPATVISSDGDTLGGRGRGVGVGRAGGPLALQTRAISSLSDLASPQELWPLYQKEENKDLRMAWVSTFASMGASDQLLEIVKTEKDPGVRQQAIRSLGNIKSDKTGQTLVDLYNSSDKDTKLAVIQALGNQDNADALVAIARKETDRDLKVDVVRKLVALAPRSKAASDYLMEIIK